MFCVIPLYFETNYAVELREMLMFKKHIQLPLSHI